MVRVPEIIPLTALRRGAAAALDRARNSLRPLVVTRRGRAVAVLMSVEAYERAEREREALLLLARSEREIAAGKGHELDDVLAEADRRLLESGE